MTMNFCPHCGHRLQQRPDARKPVSAGGESSLQTTIDEPSIDQAVLERLRPKVLDLFARIGGMSNEEYDTWVDALPRDEFLVWIALGIEGLRELGNGEPARAGNGSQLTLHTTA